MIGFLRFKSRACRRAPLTLAALLCGLLALAGCSDGGWETDYRLAPSRADAASWSASEINVIIPQDLRISEARLMFAWGDIVWREDGAGNRRAQVAAILQSAAERAMEHLSGPRKVRIEIELETFHAVTERARRLAPQAVHNIQFKIRVFDLATGAQILPTERIKADFPALTRKSARSADEIGLSQKYRITEHLVDVLAGWLGTGPDPRFSFSQFGL